MDDMIQNILASSEKDFILAYQGHMKEVHRKLAVLKKEISNQKFEMKRDKKLKSLKDEVVYFRNETLHFKELDKMSTNHIKEMHRENAGLQDDTYVLRRALLNTKVKQKAVERQLEESKADNLELLTTINNLKLQIRQLMIDNQKKDLVNAANGVILPISPPTSYPSQQSEREKVYNIQSNQAESLATSLMTTENNSQK